MRYSSHIDQRSITNIFSLQNTPIQRKDQYMNKLNIIKLNLLILTFTLLFTGCGGGGRSTVGATYNTNAVHSGQVKDSLTGKGLGNVKVSIGDSNTTTDVNGYYTFSNLTPSDEVVVNFEKEGYLLGSTKIQLKSLSEDNTTASNYLEYTMRAHTYQWDYGSTEEIANAYINIDTSISYIDIAETTYSGIISAELTILDLTTDEGKELFSGSFKGINNNGEIVQFKSYGLTSIHLKDNNGNALSFANGETGTLIFNNISSSEKPDTIPLWYYDYDQGIWFEEGYAELQDNGTYKGEISHLDTWSLNIPLEDDPGIYIGRIIDVNGAPIGDVRVYAVGENWVSSNLTTNENGVFELHVIPDEPFELTAYDYENKYAASYNGSIAAISSGDVVED